MRPCRAASRGGTLYAASPGIAAALVSALAAKTGASAVAIDVPDRNKAAVTLAERMGLKPAFETARIYRRRSRGRLCRPVRVTSFELG